MRFYCSALVGFIVVFMHIIKAISTHFFLAGKTEEKNVGTPYLSPQLRRGLCCSEVCAVARFGKEGFIMVSDQPKGFDSGIRQNNDVQVERQISRNYPGGFLQRHIVNLSEEDVAAVNGREEDKDHQVESIVRFLKSIEKQPQLGDSSHQTISLSGENSLKMKVAKDLEEYCKQRLGEHSEIANAYPEVVPKEMYSGLNMDDKALAITTGFTSSETYKNYNQEERAIFARLYTDKITIDYDNAFDDKDRENLKKMQNEKKLDNNSDIYQSYTSGDKSPQMSTSEEQNKKIKFGKWETTSKKLKSDLNNFITIFDEARKEKIKKVSDIDPRIQLLAQTGQRSAQKFLDLVDQYSPQEKEVRELASLVEEVLLNEGKFHDNTPKKYTFTENESNLATTWILPFITEGMEGKERNKINTRFKGRTDFSRERMQIQRRKEKNS